LPTRIAVLQQGPQVFEGIKSEQDVKGGADQGGVENAGFRGATPCFREQPLISSADVDGRLYCAL